MATALTEHRHYLEDHERLARFERAIAEVVRPGAVVVDLGAGTGILGQFACRAGASRVYAIDDGAMIEVAREICRANGTADRVTCLKGLSTEIDLPERADVVVADQVGYFGFEAGIIQYFADARRRFLTSTGRTLPSHLGLWLGAIEYPESETWLDFWLSKPGAVDVSPVRHLAAHTTYPVMLSSGHLLGDPVRLAEIELGTACDVIRSDVSLSVNRPGMLHGLAGFFSARLSPTVVMTNSPLAADRIARNQLLLPVDRPIPVKQHDRIAVSVTIRPADVVMAWTVTVISGNTSRSFRHSTLQGMLVACEDLTRTRPGHRPTLSLRSEAELAVLHACDGSRMVAQMEHDLLQRFPALFPSPSDAAAFVATVLGRHGL